jgi:alpha-galactosidase
MDWCGTKWNTTKLVEQTQTDQMAKSLNNTGRPMFFNFHCDDPIPHQWCINDGNSFRIGPDHHDNWKSTSEIIPKLVGIAKYAGPGAWNDPDFLMTGGAGCDDMTPGLRCPGQTHSEYRTEFSIWAITGGPLIVATDVRNMSAIQMDVLLNKEIIAVNQDSLGLAGDLLGTWHCHGSKDVCQIWGKPLSDGSWVAGLYNSDDSKHSITLDFSLVNMKSKKVSIRDLWNHKDLGTFQGNYTATGVKSHDTHVLKLTPQ